MKIKFFAQIKDFTGCKEYDLHPPHALVGGELWQRLEMAFPGITRFQSQTRLAKNYEFATPDATFQDTDEVALIPPVSGG